MSADSPLHLFEAFGVELEYMIVDAGTLNVRPITDRVFETVAGEITSDVEIGEITWSNELAAHVIELKTTDPAGTLASLPAAFADSVHRINSVLEPLGGRLMPSGMHPWMDPHREMVLWAHDYSVVYEAFNRIFDCRGHGWANLQAVHLNLPFAGDAEFGRLHAAIRVLLPILPALAASTPIVDGRPSGLMDTRLDVYRQNCRRIPSATGRVIPEPVFTSADYSRDILEPLYAEIAPHDPERVLQNEWLNARGAIARFERNAIEIRVLDVQECPQADVAICALIADVLEALTQGRWGDPVRLEACDTETLAELLLAAIRDGERTPIRDLEYLRLFGVQERGALDAGGLWKHLAAAVAPQGRSADRHLRPAIDTILERGPSRGGSRLPQGRSRRESGLRPSTASCAIAWRPEGCLSALRDFVLLTCEHGGNRVPAEFAPLFRESRDLLDSHRGYDPGALELARACARRLKVPLCFSTVTRLLVELNRSLGHKSLFSKVTKPLPKEDRRRIVQTYYLPYRSRVETEVEKGGRRVVHISLHTFTPILDGEIRRADVGLLYDPRRRGEARLCTLLKQSLTDRRPELVVRRNYPYLGKTDGFTTALRKKCGESSYVGIEIEVNQRWFFGDPVAWRRLRRDLTEAMAITLERFEGEKRSDSVDRRSRRSGPDED